MTLIVDPIFAGSTRPMPACCSRNPDPVSLREVWELNGNHRPPMSMMDRVIATPGLSPQLRGRLVKRADWLRSNAS